MSKIDSALQARRYCKKDGKSLEIDAGLEPNGTQKRYDINLYHTS